jgi:predicted transcriptional regulator
MASTGTTTVRVRRPGSERLSALAKSRQTTVVEVVHTAIDALERQEFMRGLHEDYRFLDAEGRETLRPEQADWDPLA